MSELQARPGTSGNPFSTRHTRPGAVPYLFSSDETLEGLLARLESQRFWGEIVGPHGSGKSTLLAALVEGLAQQARQSLLVALHDGERRLPVRLDRRSDLAPASVILIDGYEQLGRWQRFRLKRLCRRRGWGLIVTAHASVGLPRLASTASSLELARRVVEQLQPASAGPIDDREIDAAYERRGGNLREMLFDLYDLYERSRTR